VSPGENLGTVLLRHHVDERGIAALRLAADNVQAAEALAACKSIADSLYQMRLTMAVNLMLGDLSAMLGAMIGDSAVGVTNPDPNEAPR
jgi:hypothetical protein